MKMSDKEVIFMEDKLKEELTGQLLQSFQGMHARGHGPKASDRMRGAPMILHFIQSQEGSISPSQISKAMGTSTARITAVLGSLEKKGLIERTMDPGDRRKIQISLTEKGQEHVQKMAHDMIMDMQQLVEYLGEEDARSAIHLLQRLQDWQPLHLCPPETELT